MLAEKVDLLKWLTALLEDFCHFKELQSIKKKSRAVPIHAEKINLGSTTQYLFSIKTNIKGYCTNTLFCN